MTDRSSTRDIRDRLDALLEPLLPAGTPVAVIGFPNYDNVGDSAIWCGTMAWLDAHDVPVVYHADEWAYHPRALARALPPDGIVVFQGGGNFGDLYPWHQDLRLRVMTDHPDRDYVQLPQTIEFRDPRAAATTARTIAGVRSFSMLCREHGSIDVARESLGVRATLAPDMAFALCNRFRDAHRNAVSATASLLWLARSDDEALSGRAVPGDDDVLVTDWPDLDGTFGVTGLADERLRQAVRRTSQVSAWSLPGALIAQPHLTEVYRRLATRTVAAGVRLLCTADVAVTDRLHGHILASLIGMPHVIMETGYGKVRACYDEFTSGLPGIRFAEDPASASLAARDLAVGRTL